MALPRSSCSIHSARSLPGQRYFVILSHVHGPLYLAASGRKRFCLCHQLCNLFKKELLGKRKRAYTCGCELYVIGFKFCLARLNKMTSTVSSVSVLVHE